MHRTIQINQKQYIQYDENNIPRVIYSFDHKGIVDVTLLNKYLGEPEYLILPRTEILREASFLPDYELSCQALAKLQHIPVVCTGNSISFTDLDNVEIKVILPMGNKLFKGVSVDVFAREKRYAFVSDKSLCYGGYLTGSGLGEKVYRFTHASDKTFKPLKTVIEQQGVVYNPETGEFVTTSDQASEPGSEN